MKSLVIGVVILVLFIAGFMVFIPKSNSTQVDTPKQEFNDTNKELQNNIKNKETTSEEAGRLVEYKDGTDLDNLTGINILFFKASWCITCKQLYDALVKEKSKIPKGVTIWVVDYDSNQTLRQKYGVTSQHTLVQIDNKGNKINLWRGGYSVADVMSNVR